MIPSLSQEIIAQYASDAQTIQEPQGADFSQGVKVGKTVPAKWWNWLFSATTKRIIQSRNDADNMLTELKNVVTDAGITPSGSDNTQLTQAIVVKTGEQIDSFIEDKKGLFRTWYPVSSAHQLTLEDSDGVWADGCYAVVAYESGGWGTCISTTGDYASWHDIKSSTGQSAYDRSITLAKYKDRFFLMHTYDTQNATYPGITTHVYTSNDGAQWDQVLSETGVSSNVARFAPVMFISEERLGIIYAKGSTESQTSPFRLAMKYTNNGTDWTDNDYTGFSTNLYLNSIPWSKRAFTPVRGFEFTGGVVVGNAILGSSSITKLADVDQTYWYPAGYSSLAYSAVKLSNGTLVFYGTGNTIYTSPSTGNAPVITAHTINGISSYSICGTLKDGLYIVIKDNNGHYRFSSNGVDFTDTGVSSMIFELNDVYFSGTKKSTDLVTWTEMVMPAQYPTATVDNVIPQAGAVVANTNSASIVSLDYGETWITSAHKIPSVIHPYPMYNQVGLPNIEAALFVVDSKTVNNKAVIQSFSTKSTINTVFGHTLYLR